jgi:hypothetical protein
MAGGSGGSELLLNRPRGSATGSNCADGANGGSCCVGPCWVDDAMFVGGRRRSRILGERNPNDGRRDESASWRFQKVVAVGELEDGFVRTWESGDDWAGCTGALESASGRGAEDADCGIGGVSGGGGESRGGLVAIPACSRWRCYTNAIASLTKHYRVLGCKEDGGLQVADHVPSVILGFSVWILASKSGWKGCRRKAGKPERLRLDLTARELHQSNHYYRRNRCLEEKKDEYEIGSWMPCAITFLSTFCIVISQINASATNSQPPNTNA